MSTTATLSAVAAGLQQAWKGFCKMVNFKRRQIARAELEADNGKGKDLDGDGVVGGVGNPRQRVRSGGPTDRSADAQRSVLDPGGRFV